MWSFAAVKVMSDGDQHRNDVAVATSGR